jgi:hypothetical protein
MARKPGSLGDSHTAPSAADLAHSACQRLPICGVKLQIICARMQVGGVGRLAGSGLYTLKIP